MTEAYGALLDLLRGAGLLADGDAAAVTPLTGGVSCDVWRVDPERGPSLVVKRALPRLRVAAEWLAPVERIDSEVNWLRQVAGIDPTLVPEVLAYWPEQSTFAMRFLPDRPVWKDELAAGRIDPAFAAQVGAAIVRVHAATAHDPAAAQTFDNTPLFEALRIAPFIRTVAERDPQLAPRLRALADTLNLARTALVHGDVSPKNILVGPGGPVLLDAECATFGDPAFDLAFCTSHLLLKLVWLPDHAGRLRAAAAALVAAYRAGIDWEPAEGLMDRAAALIAALLLARVDGKSPVPYLDAPQRDQVRARARQLVAGPPLGAELLVGTWFEETVT